MATNPTLLTQPIAANGAKNVIPNTTSTAGAMSQDQGFPAETALPLGAGGVAPTREDFNGAFNLLSGILYMAQKGWVFLFDENQNYFAGCVVRDTDGKLYTAINDVLASSTHPANDATNWKIYDLSAYTKTVNSPMFNKRDVITTSGTYTAPVTGWYKITVKGGGGGGGGGHYEASSITYIGIGGGGGGEGGTGIAYKYMTAGNTATVVIGAGGNGGAVDTSGGNGGNTSVTIGATVISSNGGGGGKSYYQAQGGAGGAGTITGACGGTGATLRQNFQSSTGVAGGNGGGNGGGFGSNANSNSAGVSGGGGGGGAGRTEASGSTAGKEGGDGYVWFEYFDPSLNP